MSKTSPRTVRLEEDLDAKVQKWLEVNKNAGVADFTMLVNIALKQFIGKPQTIEFEAVSLDKGLKTATAAMKKHRKAIDELK